MIAAALLVIAIVAAVGLAAAGAPLLAFAPPLVISVGIFAIK